MNIQLKEWKVKNLSFKINDIQIEKNKEELI